MTDIEKRAESSVTFKKFGKGMDEKDVILHNILMQGKREGYIKGAKEQKAIDEEHFRDLTKMVIDKACEYFGQYLMEIGYPDDWLRDSPNIMSGEQRFRKAMEG